MLDKIYYLKKEIKRLEEQKYLDFDQRYRLAKLKLDLAVSCCVYEYLDPTVYNIISIMGQEDWRYVIRYIQDFSCLKMDRQGIQYLNSLWGK